jgi:hypothetical protein
MREGGRYHVETYLSTIRTRKSRARAKWESAVAPDRRRIAFPQGKIILQQKMGS